MCVCVYVCMHVHMCVYGSRSIFATCAIVLRPIFTLFRLNSDEYLTVSEYIHEDGEFDCELLGLLLSLCILPTFLPYLAHHRITFSKKKS